jgi:hypothetical protein
VAAATSPVGTPNESEKEDTQLQLETASEKKKITQQNNATPIEHSTSEQENDDKVVARERRATRRQHLREDDQKLIKAVKHETNLAESTRMSDCQNEDKDEIDEQNTTTAANETDFNMHTSFNASFLFPQTSPKPNLTTLRKSTAAYQTSKAASTACSGQLPMANFLSACESMEDEDSPMRPPPSRTRAPSNQQRRVSGVSRRRSPSPIVLTHFPVRPSVSATPTNFHCTLCRVYMVDRLAWNDHQANVHLFVTPVETGVVCCRKLLSLILSSVCLFN